MSKHVLAFILFLSAPVIHAAAPATPSDWRGRVTEAMPLLGHRNWILIVDSAYPLQTSPGIETIETNANQVDVLQFVVGAINDSIHVRPDIYMDAELPLVPEQDAPGARLQGKIAAARPDHREHRRDQQDLSCSRPEDQHDDSLYFRLHPTELQILDRWG
jgi:hypothetical protein